MSTTTLSRVFHGQDVQGENSYPGSGGNLNSVYAGDGYQHEQPEDEGYKVGRFPAGGVPSGAETQEFRITDSNAFNNLRGIARTTYPFDPYPANDHANKTATALRDNFEQSDMAGVSSLLPGKYSYNNAPGTLSKQILEEFNAGTSTFNSLPWGESVWGIENSDQNRHINGGISAEFNGQVQEGIQSSNIVQQYKDAFSEPAAGDVPLTPFHKTYPNFGDGHVDYGFSDPGADKASADIIRAFHAVLPEGQLAGMKKELQPVFSGVNQEAVEQRPILQSLAKQKNTLYLGGLTELPDDLKISPQEALKSGSNIPANLVQTAGELAAALDTLGYHADDSGLTTGNPYGPRLGESKLLAQTNTKMPSHFYNYLRSDAQEPLLFDRNIYEYTSNENDIIDQ